MSTIRGLTRNLAIGLSLVLPFLVNAAPLKTKNVFLIISDGFRWQDFFNGAEELLLNKTNGGVANVKATRAEFWRETPEARREALLPFFWTNIAKHGQIFGNQAKGSVASV
ncbi:MAG TPA: AP protein, partial [Verrucomicrobiae bacterium]